MYLQVKAKEVASNPISLRSKQTLYDAHKAMVTYNISRVIVSEDTSPIGILTEKDMARILYSEQDRRLDEIKLDQVMTPNPIAVNEETELERCAKIMLDKQISSILCVNSNDKLTGIITKTDLVAAYAKHFPGKHLVKDYMVKKVFKVAPEDTVRKVLSIMSKENVSRVVVERNGKPLGIITGRDLSPVAFLYSLDKDSFKQTAKDAFVPSGVTSTVLASNIMTVDPLTVRDDSPLSQAAQMMIQNRISGLPVIDANQNAIGMLTKTDVTVALASL